jgi:hypothetical protein
MQTTHVWSYRDTIQRDIGDGSALVGYDVDATDGHIGKIDETSTETSRGYLVVDTGFWIFGKKRLIPAGVVTSVDHDDRRVAVSMTKDQIKSAPDFDEMSRDDDYYEGVGSYYQGYGW